MKNLFRQVLSYAAAVIIAVTIMGGGTEPLTADAATTQTATYSGSDATTDGAITISNARVGQTYSVYKVFDATVSSSGDISYTVLSSKESKTLPSGFVTDAGGNVIHGTKDANGNITVSTASELTADEVAAIQSYLGLNEGGTPDNAVISAEVTAESGSSEAERQLTFEKLPYGYYYITSSVGSVVTIDSNNPTETITDKNGVPSISKEIAGVSDDATGTVADDGTSGTAKIGDKITYTVSLNVETNTTNLVFHDTLSNGLTLDENSLKITYTTGTGTSTDPYKEVTMNETGKLSGSTSGSGSGFGRTIGSGVLQRRGDITYTKTKFAKDKGTDEGAENITIQFDGQFIRDNIVTITYEATLNKDAVIAGEGNPNEASISYGNNQHSEKEIVRVYTYDLDVVKDDKDNKLLKGAEFELYESSDIEKGEVKSGAKPIKLVKSTATPAENESNKALTDIYKVAEDQITDLSSEGTETRTTTISAGSIRLSGLGNGTYYLKETKAPDGYNALTGLVEIKVNSASNPATTTAGDGSTYQNETHTDETTIKTYTSGGVEVENNAGVELPSTGGIGTTIFYVIGGILVAGAAILLIFRRRKRA